MMKRQAPICVVKVGGSLLSRTDLVERLNSYLCSNRAQRFVLIVGGGRNADALRDLDQIHALGDRLSHALALRILDVTAHLLANCLPRTRLVFSATGLWSTWNDGLIPVLSPEKLLTSDDVLSKDEALPHRWSVTTDSISARIAVLLGAQSLLLLKSAGDPSSLTVQSSSELGLTDPCFPTAASQISRIMYFSFHGTGAPILSSDSCRDPIVPRQLNW